MNEMKKTDLSALSLTDLVDRFVTLGLLQDDALLADDTKRYTRFYHQIAAIDAELRSRGPAARLALAPLFSHANWQVRLNAANKLLGLIPQEARPVFDEIRKSRISPYCLDAGMILSGLDDGSYKPT
ncbi:MAG TPA: DUF2019 domain-containing protein [Stellaceae bacterium]|nr:DUF2019 domain-containing protein [Stellaceae bacterium]